MKNFLQFWEKYFSWYFCEMFIITRTIIYMCLYWTESLHTPSDSRTLEYRMEDKVSSGIPPRNSVAICDGIPFRRILFPQNSAIQKSVSAETEFRKIDKIPFKETWHNLYRISRFICEFIDNNSYAMLGVFFNLPSAYSQSHAEIWGRVITKTNSGKKLYK